MFEFTETTVIGAPPPMVWAALQDLDGWWPASNPDHESLERLDDRGIEVGARLRIKEKIAGIPGEAVGEITEIHPCSSVTWEAPRARYHLLGFPFTVGEGVTWRLEDHGSDGTGLSAHVWATFPGRLGRLLQWVFSHVFGGIERDREHTRTELNYLKGTLEAGQ
ncbi:MAG TPA: SRPBCC family protein [Acidimicrobiales bacterium]|jgi:uncharacterized protein YndB with AHSA1/START domain|nr:SRPBCC family protein [Acidimicrobiales bacterium]